MHERTMTIEIVSVGLLTAALHYKAITDVWYWQFWWADVLVHFLGGLFVGLLVSWVLAKRSSHLIQQQAAVLITFVTILVVATSWEVFEYIAGVSLIEGYALDTFFDLLLGVLGALSGLLYARAVADAAETT